MDIFSKTAPMFKMSEELSEDLLIIMSMEEDSPEEARAASNEFWKRYQDYVWRNANYLSRNAFYAEEDFPKAIVSNTFLKVHQIAGLYDPSKNGGVTADIRIKAWLGPIIKNAYRNLFKKYKKNDDAKKSYLSIVRTDPENVSHPESEAEEASEVLPIRKECFEKAMLSLKERECDVLMTYMRYSEGNKHLPDAELRRLSDLYGTSTENLRQIKRRAMQKIELFINKCEGGAT